jgi:hypothetical protein
MLWLHFEEVDMMFEGPIHLMNCIYWSILSTYLMFEVFNFYQKIFIRF